ncbi:hypothetical protein L7F22_026458 [Adiantum nelumboides]|nr:hypothetical protein [Adiantum nelumboides]
MSFGTRKGSSSSTRSTTIVENDPKSPKCGDSKTTVQPTTSETMIMAYLVSLQETVNKQGEDLRALAMENGTLRVLVVENENLKRTLEMQTTRLMQLEVEVKECKRFLVDLNALKEQMCKVEHDHVLKEEKLHHEPGCMRHEKSPCKSLETSNDLYILCNTWTYDNGSSLDEDLNTLLANLKQKAGSSSYHVGRATTLSGAYQCRGNLAPDACSKCVADATQSALSSCPSVIGSCVQLDGYFLRYENYTFAMPDSSIVLEVCNISKDDSSAFQSQVSNLLGKVTAAAPANGRLFASVRLALSSNATLYALAQCLDYLSQTEHSHCLAAHPRGRIATTP